MLRPALHIVPDMPTADEVLPYLREIDANVWYSNFGPLVTRFEKQFAARMAQTFASPTPLYAATVSSGYHALNLALALKGIGAGHTVLVPAVTFPACPLAIQNLGAEAVLCDVGAQSGTLTPAIARAAATQMKIDAVMPVCLYGMPLPAEEWDAFVAETGIPVIIDAAAAIGAQRYPRHALVAHSLHATKPFGAGEGGLVLTAEEGDIAKIHTLSNFGAVNRIALGGGQNAKMSEYHAAVALAQLDRWERIKTRRASLFQAYLHALDKAQAPATVLDGLSQAVVSNLMVAVKHPDLKALCAALGAEGIACHRTYLPPLYAHPYYNNLKLCNTNGRVIQTPDLVAKNSHMPNSDRLEQTLLGLPFYPQMEDDDVSYIASTVTRLLQEQDAA